VADLSRGALHLWIDLLADASERLKPTLPEEAERHFCTAYAASLKGFRTLLDAEISRAEERAAMTDAAESTAGRTASSAAAKRQRNDADLGTGRGTDRGAGRGADRGSDRSASRHIPIEDTNEHSEY